MATFSISNITENEFGTRLAEIKKTDVSFFNEALAFILEQRKEYNRNLTQLYSVISESANGKTEVLNEGFQDFFKSIGEIIDKFIKFLKSIFERFVNLFNRMIKSDKYIEKNKDKFKDFREEHQFEFEGYIFTLDPSIPLVRAAAEYKEDFFNIEDVAGIQKAYSMFMSKIQNNFYDEFRGTILGRHGKYIASNEYSQELFAEYRNGDRESSKITCDYDVVSNSLAFFLEFDKLLKETTKLRDTIQKEYEDIKKYVKNSIRIDSYGNAKIIDVRVIEPDSTETHASIAKEDIKYMNLFVKAKVSQIEEMINIHTLAFTSKLDAIKEKYQQDRTLLYKALYKIQGGKINESSEEDETSI